MDHLTDEEIVDLALADDASGGRAGADLGDDAESANDAVTRAHFEHLRGCAHCSGELAAYQHVIGIAHEARAERDDRRPYPTNGWTAISRELGFAAAAPTVISSATSPDAANDAAPDILGAHPKGPEELSGRGHRKWWLMAAAVIAVLIAIGGGIAIGRATVSKSPDVASTTVAALAPLPGDSTPSTGQATITDESREETLTVTTHQLPLRQGFYQVWLYDQAAGKMVPIGTLNAQGAGSFTLAPSIDIKAYNIVDVSAQDLNGNPAHGTSVLRGTLTQ